jgi:hypothetical protein
MAYTTFTPKAANTVKAQTIAAITDRSAVVNEPHYKLADGTLVATTGVRTVPGGYTPQVGDYFVLPTQANTGSATPAVWKASVFTANYS